MFSFEKSNTSHCSTRPRRPAALLWSTSQAAWRASRTPTGSLLVQREMPPTALNRDYLPHHGAYTASSESVISGSFDIPMLLRRGSRRACKRSHVMPSEEFVKVFVDPH